MSLWPFGDSSFRSNISPQSRELLKSWTPENNESDWRGSAAIFDAPATTTGNAWPTAGMEATQPQAQAMPAMEITNYTAIKTTVETTKFELPQQRAETKFEPKFTAELGRPMMPPVVADTSKSPLMRVHEALEERSQSSQWLNQRGYLEPFKSPHCVLDLSFQNDKGGTRVGAVLSAPCGSKRTVFACHDGTSFQRITGPSGQELVRFSSNGQIVEMRARV